MDLLPLRAVVSSRRGRCVPAPSTAIHPLASEAGFEEERELYIDPDVCIDCGACEPVTTRGPLALPKNG